MVKFEIFADVASVSDIESYSTDSHVTGFTTNPTLLAGAGITNYREFAELAMRAAKSKPLSFEVVADDLPTIAAQARKIGGWGQNLYVKIPITTTNAESCVPIIRTLLDEGIAVNATAVMTDDQVTSLCAVLSPNDDIIISVFAGRIADTGVDPVPVMRRYVQQAAHLDRTRVLWASPREVLNIVQAREIGCHIITVTPDLLRKSKNIGKNLSQFSLETVKMFFDDARNAGLDIQ